MSTEQKTITINLDQAQPDPSQPNNTNVTAKAVDVVPEYFRVRQSSGISKTTFTFNLNSADNDNATERITGFRYMNTSSGFTESNEWFVPKGWTESGNTWPQGSQFRNMSISDDGRSMTVDLKRGNEVLYVYVIEWLDADGNKRVCDPKVRNEG